MAFISLIFRLLLFILIPFSNLHYLFFFSLSPLFFHIIVSSNSISNVHLFSLPRYLTYSNLFLLVSHLHTFNMPPHVPSHALGQLMATILEFWKIAVKTLLFNWGGNWTRTCTRISLREVKA